MSLSLLEKFWALGQRSSSILETQGGVKLEKFWLDQSLLDIICSFIQTVIKNRFQKSHSVANAVAPGLKFKGQNWDLILSIK